nr:hypothetical protein [Tanacetum cinerariifolium]
MAFPCLQELETAQNSSSLTDAMSVYIERKINEDLHFAAGLTLQCAKFSKQLSQTKVLKLLEIKKSTAEVHMQVYKMIDFLTVMREFTIYEMTIGCSVWMVRYHVHTNDFMTPIPEGWSISSNVWSIVLGEREQDLFLVIKLSGKVVQYNRISKTLHEIYDCGSNQVDDNHDDNDDDDELLQQFQAEHNVYEFIPSYANELMEIIGSTELHKRMRYDDLRRKNARRRVLIHEMEALREREVAIDSLESLKQTHSRENAKLAALTDAIVESLAGIYEKERHVVKLDLNDKVFIGNE